MKPRHAVAAAGIGLVLLLGAWDSGFGGWHLTPRLQAQADVSPSRPRLVVLLLADQLRGDAIERYAHRWRGGLRTLREEGAWFSRAEYPYLNTATCAGHVTIATGALPRTHGIVLNRWWDREAGRTVNCMEDDSAPHVSYGAPVASGHSARRVLVPTLADRLRDERGARVVSLALKARSAVGLAGHGGDAVTWFDEANRTFVTSRAFADAAVPSVRAFVERDRPEADLGRLWTLHDRAATYLHGDIGAGERPKFGWTALFPHALAGADGADAQFFDRWQKSPFSDAYLSRMAMALADDMGLGTRDTTDFLAISFSALDLMGHDFGPESREVEDLLIRLDETIGALLRHLDTRLGRDGYVVALTSDHGAAPIPEQSGGGRIASEDVQQVAEQALAASWGPPVDGRYVAWVGSGAIYLSPGVYERLRGDTATRETLMRALLAVPGMQRVITRDEVSADSRDPLLRAAAAGFVDDRTGDLLLVPQRLWVLELRAENDATNHGTWHDYDRHVPILLRGHGIRPGVYRDRVTPADIAPTLAQLAGVGLPHADGRVLTAALR